jgi:hypothetical protein
MCDNKFRLAAARVNDVYGDKHLICACPPIESYNQQKYRIMHTTDPEFATLKTGGGSMNRTPS